MPFRSRPLYVHLSVGIQPSIIAGFPPASVHLPGSTVLSISSRTPVNEAVPLPSIVYCPPFEGGSSLCLDQQSLSFVRPHESVIVPKHSHAIIKEWLFLISFVCYSSLLPQRVCFLLSSTLCAEVLTSTYTRFEPTLDVIGHRESSNQPGKA